MGQVRDKLEGHRLQTFLEFGNWLRYDTQDNTVRENEEEYYEIRDELEALGLSIEDPLIEHDCISGDIVLL